MKSAMKFEMMYQARMLSGEIAMKAMNLKAMTNQEKSFDTVHKKKYLKTLKHCRFEAGYYDKNRKPFYTEIAEVRQFDTEFFEQNMKCYAVIEDKSEHLGVRYVVLKENDLSNMLKKLRIKIIGYLVFSFILMGIVGYF